MKKKSKNMNATVIAAVLLIIAMISLGVRLLHRLSEKCAYPSSNDALSSGETAVDTENTPEDVITSEMPTSADIPSETESVTYPAESLPDYEVHTLPVTSVEITTEEAETAPLPPETTGASDTAAFPESEEASETPEPLESTAELLPAEFSTEFSENSDNLRFIGTWLLEYDLAPAQEAALKARYSLPRLPEKTVILRLSAVLADDGTLHVIYTREDAAAFKTALSDWYAEAAAIHAETGASGIQKTAFLSWAAYRKGLYALLSPDTVNNLNAHWHAEGNTVFITDEGEIQAEITAESDPDGITVTDFRVTNDDFRDTVTLLQESLGFTPPFRLTKQ